MRTLLAITMTLLAVAAVWSVNDATAYEAYQSTAYVRGYLGYFIALAPAFMAGVIATYLCHSPR